jgi:hypothetical protein
MSDCIEAMPPFLSYIQYVLPIVMCLHLENFQLIRNEGGYIFLLTSRSKQ